MHVLDPLTLEEIQESCDILKREKELSDSYRFAWVMTYEPPQQEVLHSSDTDFDRCAFLSVFNKKTNETFEAVVNLNSKKVVEWKQIVLEAPPYGKPPILIEDFQKCEQIVKADPTWRAAMEKRGLNDEQIDKIQVDAFSAGYFDEEEEREKRIVKGISFYRDDLKDNGYARPIEGVVAIVDLGNEKVLRVIDDGRNVPIPKEKINYDSDSYPEKRKDLKPLDIIQEEGPSFKVNGWEVNWQNWSFHVGFTPREGLVLHQIKYLDEGKERPIIYRASVTDMIVPYADPSVSHYWKSAFDAGEYGLGKLANELKLGCDCLGNIYYFDVPSADDFGNARLIKNAICMHEEDAGTLWKHYETRNSTFEVRRARELVVSFFTTIGNYDYGFYWRFGQDGSLKLEIKLTGIVQTAAIFPEAQYEWGGKLTPELAAPTHQHFFNARLHMMVDGEKNSFSEHEFYPIAMGGKNPYGNAFGSSQKTFEHEGEAARSACAQTQRTWKIFNPNSVNGIGTAPAYKLELPETPLLLADEESYIYKRGGFASKQVWVTQYDPQEKYAAGDYPNQSSGGCGLPSYIKQNRKIDNDNLVLWVTLGSTHFPRPEDFPVMPTSIISAKLQPFGFFKRNPAMDLPQGKVQEKGDTCCSSLTY
ncbi:primary-amine oxidase [Legionella pneumophila]|uniref:primary-amine oxidase n=1 Tax=Legionella pneumophila TaxID=446 RepID=UPI000D07B367|nr:primary-amine oxidase [Legionella pneumophila]